ncbi:hypothetical protein KVV02_000857 [Mortierella alpina]|uniref:Uncharacterized protein n=1 Tax=Mortierella alpina TaxID=64518 RepID=A0A9P8D285_MORAP|nr:hypothetical protein KVV02_000857 [Mortierella alpina]
MAYNALDTHDVEMDTATLLQRSSFSSSVFHDNSAQNKAQFDDYKTCHSRACCSRQERQLTTPTPFFIGICAAEWMQDFEEIARANNWSSQAKLDIVPIYLKDTFRKKTLKTWFRNNQHEWHDFDSFKLAFVAQYRKDSSGQIADVEVRRELVKETSFIILVLLTSMGCVFLLFYFLMHFL